MKTKKEILQWWINRGKVVNRIDDYKDFYKRIDPKLQVKEIRLPEVKYHSGHFCLEVMTKRAKYSVDLYFSGLECYKIAGF